MQELIIGLVFVAALAYLGLRVYRSFARKQAGCGKGCGCDADTMSKSTVTRSATPEKQLKTH